MSINKKQIFLCKTMLYAVISIPFVQVVWGVYAYEFLDPVDEILKITGKTVIKLLIASLSISPLVWWLGWKWLYIFRRMIGVSAFVYVIMHGIVWALGQELILSYMVRDVVKHPYVVVGVVSFVLMIPLTITSTNGWVKRLGGKRWQSLHRLSYGIILLGGLHYIMQEKLGNALEPYYYLGAIILLLLIRVIKIRFFKNK